jgi:hypothetical protein
MKPSDIAFFGVSVKDIGRNISKQTGKAGIIKVAAGKRRKHTSNAHTIEIKISVSFVAVWATQLLIRCAVT